jgi:hypothetical protein
MREKFEREFVGDFLRPEPGEREALRIVLQYAIDTELFDRTQPGYWSPRDRECWIPLKMGASQRYASEQRAKCKHALEQLGVTIEMSRRLCSYVAELSHSACVELLNRLKEDK